MLLMRPLLSAAWKLLASGYFVLHLASGHLVSYLPKDLQVNKPKDQTYHAECCRATLYIPRNK
jgi:hypothetical protein